jgi:hypothetical protein
VASRNWWTRCKRSASVINGRGTAVPVVPSARSRGRTCWLTPATGGYVNSPHGSSCRPIGIAETKPATRRSKARLPGGSLVQTGNVPRLHRARFGAVHAVVVASVLFLHSATLPTLPAAAQYEGTLEIATEDICYMLDQTAGMRTIYVYHRLNPGAVASRFKVVTDPGVTMTYVSETFHTASAVGNTRDGITLCYGVCRQGEILLVSMSYMAFATSAPCGQIRIVPHPDSETVEAIRCDSVPVGTYIQDLYVVGPGGVCGCPSGHAFQGTPQTFGCAQVPVQPTTWGAIKALYVN